MLTYEETCVPTLPATFNNGFFSAFLYAYNNHGDVKITPDDVWLVIMMYFGNFVRKNFGKVKHLLLPH